MNLIDCGVSYNPNVSRLVTVTELEWSKKDKNFSLEDVVSNIQSFQKEDKNLQLLANYIINNGVQKVGDSKKYSFSLAETESEEIPTVLRLIYNFDIIDDTKSDRLYAKNLFQSELHIEEDFDNLMKLISMFHKHSFGIDLSCKPHFSLTRNCARGEFMKNYEKRQNDINNYLNL